MVEFAPNLMAVQLDNGGAAMLRRRSSPSAWGAYQQSDHRHRARGRRPAAELCRRRRVADRHGGLLGGDPPAGRAGPRLRAAGGRTRGIHIDGQCRTSDPDVLAIGECALWDNKIYGLVAPGYQMARIAAATLAGEDACFSGADMSTKLKLLGSTWPRLAMRRGARRAVRAINGPTVRSRFTKKSSSVRTAKPRLAACWWGCQRLCHAAADDAERHGAAAASGESDPARAGGSRAEGARRRGAAGQRADLLLP